MLTRQRANFQSCKATIFDLGYAAMTLLNDRTSLFIDTVPDSETTTSGSRFLIERPLGQGGCGSVFLGYDTVLDRNVAIKVINPELSAITIAAGTAFDEARALADIEHRHVVPVYDAGTTNQGEVYFVSKFIDGCTLSHAFEKGFFSQHEFLEKILEICSALETVHSSGVIHRDIKPDNILVDHSRRAVLIDFGIAAPLDGSKWLLQGGTPLYMSPEQARGQDHLLDQQTDIYSLGAILYRGLTGSPPQTFYSDSLASSEGSASPDRERPNPDNSIPPVLLAICQKALSINKSDRYLSVAELSTDLRLFLNPENRSTISDRKPPVVIPRGFKAFGPDDTQFFLTLVPGRREPHSQLPGLIHRWKYNIEDRGFSGQDPFRVGVFFGPSGSGKTSLINSGLLPNLEDSVIVIRLDASCANPEKTFKQVLCRRFPHLDQSEGLSWLVGRLRQGAMPTGSKLLIVLDQFEQWLHAHQEEAKSSALTKTLRQCNGSRVQALVAVREEFFPSVARLMEDLDLPMQVGENVTFVEPFESEHGKHVLECLGRGLDRLPETLKRQHRSFLEQAIELTSESGRISPLRLSLFTQIFEKREWSPRALSDIRNSSELDLIFLEQIFENNDSPLQGKQKEARIVLSVLLPEKRSLIRGPSITFLKLKSESGLARKSLEEIIVILDRELRLITPTESGYQLSHDYLVPALRAWFTEDQRKSLKGLALLQLEDQAIEWHAGDRKKLLPRFSEWVWFRILTRKASYSPEAQKLIRAANRFYWNRLLLLTGTSAFIFSALFLNASRKRAKDSIHQLFAARPAELSTAAEKVDSFSFWTKSWLQQECEVSQNPERKWRSALNLVADEANYQKILIHDGLTTAEPEELKVILSYLRPLSGQSRDSLKNIIKETGNAKLGLSAVCALASEQLPEEFWLQEGKRIVSWLDQIQMNAHWLLLLEPAASNISNQLREATIAGSKNAAFLLSQLAGKDAEYLVNEFGIARKDQIPFFIKHLGSHRDINVKLFQKLSSRSASSSEKANFIVGLMALGFREDIQSKIDLREPELCAQLILRLGSLDLNQLADFTLSTMQNPAWFRALLLSLSTHSPEALTSTKRENVKIHLLSKLASVKDPAILSAILYLAKKWDLDVPTPTPPEEAKWAIGRKSGLLFSVIETERPIKFGAQKFAIAQTELTHGLLSKVRDLSTVTKHPKQVAPAGTIWEAFKICNELSELDGFDPCYEAEPNSTVRLKPKKDYFALSGYRIPSSEEWNYAAFGVQNTEFIFGRNDQELANQYCWHSENSNQMKPVGQLFPNQFGLYDIHGNLGELVLDPKKFLISGIQTDETLKNESLVLGGTWSSTLSDCGRTGEAIPIFHPSSKTSYYTLRIVRTISEK